MRRWEFLTILAASSRRLLDLCYYYSLQKRVLWRNCRLVRFRLQRTLTHYEFQRAKPVKIDHSTRHWITLPSPAEIPPTSAILDETIVVVKNNTGWLFNKEVSLFVNEVGPQTISATLNAGRAPTQIMQDKGVGYTAVIKAKRIYKVTVTRIEFNGSRATFRVTSHPN